MGDIMVHKRYQNNNGMDAYSLFIKDLALIPRISKEEEMILGYQILERDIDAVYRLIEGNIPLAIYLAKFFCGRGVDFLDLVQEACLGLNIAARRFDIRKNVRFSTYASKYILKRLRSIVARMYQGISLSEEEYLKMQKVKGFQNNGERFNMDECSKQTKISLRDVLMLLSFMDGTRCLNEKVIDGYEIQDLIVDEKSDTEKIALQRRMIEHLRYLLSSGILSEKEKIIIESRFGLKGQELTLEQLGMFFGYTKENVRKIQNKALKKLYDGFLANDVKGGNGKK